MSSFFVLSIIATFGILATIVTVTARCPSSLSRYEKTFEFNSSCYAFFRSTAAFDIAEKVCKLHHGHLASIHSKTENEAVHHLMKDLANYTLYFAWIGLSDVATEGKYEWIDGTANDYNNFGADVISYTAMNPEIEDCVVMNAVDGTWDAITCGHNKLFWPFNYRPFVCQFTS